ncbi:M42 family metallopeptidase [Shewanella intestini]|uniref:M42 family metallopeptidase n=1 Tax=Shewanella intestini TaxID=2017544 RepID=A0ABS5HZP8_9GAMM|nr:MULTISPECIES: M42 family metallopeptidase [Shewanella]MBR9727053.1 M42 family metallopeptidase [Shewanella intestini]MRG35854.1 M20/M25/M40 family metallo-hydrolase [Shewanella sp. XMDDZSB0408]
MSNRIEELRKLTELDAVPGNEGECRQYMRQRLDVCADKVEYDRLGSIIGSKVGAKNGPRVMLAGHMDEVGFMVSKIDDNGFLKFTTLGGWWSQVMLAQQVKITTASGEKIMGVIGSKPPHILKPEERTKPAEIDSMYIDIGVSNKEEAEKAGIKPGDMITPYIEFREMVNGDYLLGKAFDNRIGCAIALEVMEALTTQSHPNELFSVGTVQEEVGLRGAQTAAHIVQPEIAFAVDVGIADDTPGCKNEYGAMGKGLQITLKDASMIGHKALREFMVALCEELDIPFQYQVMNGGGTDAGKIHTAGAGAPSMSISIPSRYIHSHTSMIHKQDYINCVTLLTEAVKRLDRETVDKIIRD